MRTNFRVAVPSRNSNPFATCWTRPGAIPYLFADGMSAELVIAKLADLGWWGEIIGPHGSGKSTLLATLAPRLAAAERPVHIVDGFEQLRPLERWRVRRRCRRTGQGLLVTSHLPTGLPTLIALAPDFALVERLVSELCAGAATHVAAGDLVASHSRHGLNVREVFFDLYNRHEELRRQSANELRGGGVSLPTPPRRDATATEACT